MDSDEGNAQNATCTKTKEKPAYPQQNAMGMPFCACFSLIKKGFAK